MTNQNATNLGQPPECDPLWEAASDEVNAVFAQIPQSVVDALDLVDPDWASKTEEVWIDIRRAELAYEENERRISSEEP